LVFSSAGNGSDAVVAMILPLSGNLFDPTSKGFEEDQNNALDFGVDPYRRW
jgi:hypothetical protein